MSARVWRWWAALGAVILLGACAPGSDTPDIGSLQDLSGDTVPGEVPYEELDLPPDERLPPAEGGDVTAPGGASAGTGGATPAARPTTHDVNVLSGMGDYCTLFRENGGVMAEAEEVMADGPAHRVPEVLDFAAALFERGASIGPGELSGAHGLVASTYRGYREVLADHRNSFEAAARDEDGSARLAALEAPELGTAIQQVAMHLTESCGVSIF